MSVGPLISCIMPSKNPPEMVELAIRSFAAQTYQARELVVVTANSSFEAALDLIANSDSPPQGSGGGGSVILHIVPPGLSIGELRNVAIRASRGSIIAHWDDDDWSHPTRLERQVARLTRHGFSSDISKITGCQRYYAIDEAEKKAWVVGSIDGKAFGLAWVAGGTMAYWRRAWERWPFNPLLRYGEDTQWPATAADDMATDVATIPDLLYVARLHPGNTSPKAPGTLGWTPCDYDEVRAFMEGK